MRQQHTLMKFDPATGEPKPYPSHADQWREWHGKATAWLFNPWSGQRRDAGDVGSDPFGYLILPPGEPVYSASENTEQTESKTMAEKLSVNEKTFLRLVAKGQKRHAGWAKVDRLFYSMVRKIPHELIEYEPEDEGRGRARLTQRGKAILDEIGWL